MRGTVAKRLRRKACALHALASEDPNPSRHHTITVTRKPARILKLQRKRRKAIKDHPFPNVAKKLLAKVMPWGHTTINLGPRATYRALKRDYKEMRRK